MRDPTERFSDRAETYAKYRPGYPDDTLRFLEALVAPSAAVADIGSGTGILTRELLKSGYDVWAVEPNEAMRTAAIVEAAKKIFEAHQAGGKITFEYETKVYLGRFNR
jgi:SAM-dependent methyltransferase